MRKMEQENLPTRIPKTTNKYPAYSGYRLFSAHFRLQFTVTLISLVKRILR